MKLHTDCTVLDIAGEVGTVPPLLSLGIPNPEAAVLAITAQYLMTQNKTKKTVTIILASRLDPEWNGYPCLSGEHFSQVCMGGPTVIEPRG
jgi:hypothetical protein